MASADLALFYWRFAATISRRFSYSFMQHGRRVAARLGQPSHLDRSRRCSRSASPACGPGFGNSFPLSFHGTFLGGRGYWPGLTLVAGFENGRGWI